MKVLFKHSSKGLTAKFNDQDGHQFEDGQTYDLAADKAASLMKRFPYNFIKVEAVKVPDVPEGLPDEGNAIEKASDKMVSEDKPKTKKKGKSK